MTTKFRTFKVRGGGTFPIDMLRYDRCWPFTQQDVHAIESERGKRTVTLETAHDASPTPSRWNSFLWGVVS